MAALAALCAVAGLLGPVIEVAKLIAAPVRRQFNYLCCFHSNVNGLKDEANNLYDKTSGLQMKVDSATNNAQLIFPSVETWLRNSGEKKNEINRILDQVPNVGNGCLKVGERYSLSKRAKKATIDIKELVGKCDFSDISGPPPTAASASVQLGTRIYEFESRRQIEEEIVKCLEDEKNVTKIGICGMGGLGKTTMAQKIMNIVLEKTLFDEVVMAVVSQPVNKSNIQLQIARQLGLEFRDDDVLISRANLLRSRLRVNKRILLVLDDVWEILKMEELGIHCEYGCTVVLTSRNTGVLSAMHVEEVFQLRILDEKEAWILFRGNVGTCVDDVVLNPVAKDVMRECKGLPLALATVGLALKDENDVSIWEDAIGQLRRSNPTDIQSIIEQVYNPLKLSYDRLGEDNVNDDKNKNAKSLFLLCCLFPEDCDIPLKHLAYFAMGLHLFQDIQELKEVRGRTSALIKTLKTRGLLLDGSDKDHVRMHDIVRDVSIYIASQEKRVNCSDCTWISSHVDGGARFVPLMQSCFPKLKLLLLNNKVEEQEMEMNEDKLIGESTELNVLFKEEYGLLKSLPLIISLTALVLHRCKSLDSIALVGQMKSLEILICSSCDSVKELSEQVRGLKSLKRLEISYCPNLKRVAAGVISSLVRLEELKIVGSFDNWEGGEIDEEGGKEAATNASLREIESLKKLRCLDIHVSDIALAAQPLRLISPYLLVQFRVQFGGSTYDYGILPKESYQKRMSLILGYKSAIDWGDLSKNIFLTRTECLAASGNNQVFKLNLAAAPSIRWLTLKLFTNKKNITSAATAAFPNLEFLCLIFLTHLEEIWDDDAPIPSNSFHNLKHLQLEDLWALKRLGKIQYYDAANDFFLQLETIYIEACNEIEHLLVLVPDEEEHDMEDDLTAILLFPKLKKLTLKSLPKLRSICSNKGIESIKFPLLAQLDIRGCGNLKWLVSRDDDDDHYQDGDDSLHLFCHPKKVSFPNLEILILMDNMESKNVWCDQVPVGFFTGLVELYIFHYSKIRSLFPSSSKIPQNLVNLKKLEIVGCKEIVKVIEAEEEGVSTASSSCDHPTKQHTPPLFPSLQHLYMSHLPNLDSVCEWSRVVEFPSLKMLEIYDCHEMKSFNARSLVTTPCLQTVRINLQELECVDDLNGALHRRFQQAKMEREEEEGASEGQGEIEVA